LHAFGFPDEWVEYYIKEGGHKHDPIPQTVIRRSMPLWWSEIAASTRAKSSARDYLVRLRQTILGDGIAITVFGPAGRNGYVGLGFGSGARVPPERQILTSQLGMQLAHLRYCQVVAAMNVPTTLSARETQVVLLMAHGSTNKEIAEHLNISRSSVDTYIGRLFAKLDVQERTGAVLRAAALGLLA
ncbi:MAG: LuxR C-terminal-related transcriptional regulator, partial [Pseudomonadota bacterium]